MFSVIVRVVSSEITHMSGSDRWRIELVKSSVRRDPGGGSLRYCHANRSIHFGIVAKDLSNHLKAGSLQSSPQDGWSQTALNG